MTGLSRAQMTRLIQFYSRGEAVKPKPYRRNRFASRYNQADIELLASVDEAHETLSGPATQKILHREFHDFGDKQYERLAPISVAHLYNCGRAGRTAKSNCVPDDPAGNGGDWRAASAAAGRATGLSARGHGASRRSGGSQRGVPHQRCR